MPPAENLTELNRWIKENVASLTAAVRAARTPQDALKVEQEAGRFLKFLESKDRTALAALAAIRSELAGGRPYHQQEATWTRRLAQLREETSAHQQVRSVLREQMTSTRLMVSQLQQMQRRSAQVQRPGTPPTQVQRPGAPTARVQLPVTPPIRVPVSPPPRGAGSPAGSPAGRPAGSARPAFPRGVTGLGLILVLALAAGTILDRTSPRAPAAKATATVSSAVTAGAGQTPTRGPAADLTPTQSLATAAPTNAAVATAAVVATTVPAPTAVPVATTTVVATATAVPTPQPAPTATAVVATATPAPSATAVPTAAAATATPVSTATPAPTTAVVATATPATVANVAANLRTGPGTDYPIAGAVAQDQAVTVVARNPGGDWYQLSGGLWVYGPLLSSAPVVPVAAVIPPPPPPTATLVPTP